MDDAVRKPDLRVFKEDVTEHWTEDVRRRAGRLFDVYLFDANRRVHVAEFAPSYEMQYVGPTWDGSGPDRCDSEEGKTALFEDVMEAVAENDLVRYFHCTSVSLGECKPLALSDEEWAGCLRDADGNHDKAYEVAVEKKLDYCRCNGYCY